jgi:hypothetical protein
MPNSAGNRRRSKIKAQGRRRSRQAVARHGKTAMTCGDRAVRKGSFDLPLQFTISD